jgi:hypothetical protein
MLYDSVWGAILRRRLNETQAKFVCTKSYYDDRHPKKVTERLPTLEKVELWNSRELKRCAGIRVLPRSRTSAQSDEP